ncbi:MAG TPA: site-specific integrase [Ilumatobacter sp.]|nr:site-specific integrase [Ilumatobacter sp.]
MIQRRGRKWRVVVQAPADPLTGKRTQLSGSAATEKEAVALERRLRLLAESGVDGRMTIRQLVAEWRESDLSLAPTTLANYYHNQDKHILPVLGDKRVEEIRPRLVSQYLKRLRDKHGLQPATVRKVRTVLSALMSYAVQMEYVESNAVMKIPPPPLDDTERVAPTMEETARILLQAERTDPEFYAYLWVAAEEGGRRGETLGLRWGGVDFDRSTLTIEGVVSVGRDGAKLRRRTKSKKPRTIALSGYTLDLLRAHRATLESKLSQAAGEPVTVDPDGFVFSGGRGRHRNPLDGKHWYPGTATRRFGRIREAAGVSSDIDLHGLRHTMITELLTAGVDPRTVMGRAGHSSETMVMTVYGKVRPAVDSAAADLWGQLLAQKLDALRTETPVDEARDDKHREAA